MQVLEAACAPGTASACQLAALAALRFALQSLADGPADPEPSSETPDVDAPDGVEHRAAWALACFARTAPPAAATARRLLLGDRVHGCSPDAMRDEDVQARRYAGHISLGEHDRVQPCGQSSTAGEVLCSSRRKWRVPLRLW